jgi:hypothetical protein
METELLKNQLQNIRNHLTTLSGNIDNTLLIYNEMSRTRTRATNRTNLNNLFQELRNNYPSGSNPPNNTNPPNPLNNTNPPNPPNNTNNTNPIYPLNPELVEITLFNAAPLEDVQIYPSLRTLRESSIVSLYNDLETTNDNCSICRDSFEDTCIIRKLNCDHIFHISCIDTWLETNIRCPLCRVDLREHNESEIV